jgi:hypothetical protein
MSETVFMTNACPNEEFTEVDIHDDGSLTFKCRCTFDSPDKAMAHGLKQAMAYIDWDEDRKKKEQVTR